MRILKRFFIHHSSFKRFFILHSSFLIFISSFAQRPAVSERCFSSLAVEAEISRVSEQISDNKLRSMFVNCFPNTLDTTVKWDKENGSEAFVITGDINAMWLRDSSAQLTPYLFGTKDDKELRELIASVIRRQTDCLLIDPYANAFNPTASGDGWQSDYTDMKPEVFERKWEIDSECYPIRLAYNYWKISDDTTPFDAKWLKAMKLVYETLREQQRYNGKGQYRFQRKDRVPTDTQQGYGWGAPVKPCGLIFSAFRPSDDATTFGFLVPSNMFAVVSLRQLAEMAETISHDTKFAQKCREFADEVDNAIKQHAIVNHPKYGDIYAYEVDGYGNHLLMDDANVPSLLSAPYLGYCQLSDTIYQNTRRFVWSEDNPYFFTGRDGEGIGGPHVGEGYAWPMSIIMRALTSSDSTEIRKCLAMLRNTDADTGFMHESFHVNDHHRFTRKWFAWANNLFGELIIKVTNDYPTLLCSALPGGEINYATFNIRYKNNDDDSLRCWEHRRDSLANFIISQQLDIIGMQEVLHTQRLDLSQRLKDYDFVGVGRDDGMTKGEYSPIYYRRNRFKVLDSGTFWLSDKPSKAGSLGWDAACCRIATWAKMHDKVTGQVFMAVNTHFDHVGKEARRQSALLIIERIKKIAGDKPAILTGDFNVDENSEAYATITQNDFRLIDAQKCAERTAGATYTWHNFGKLRGDWRSKIDFVFVTPQIEVERSWIPPLNVRRSIQVPYMSDHNPVITRIRFRE